jgi:flagella basal body P-ring formation protein FlgA
MMTAPSSSARVRLALVLAAVFVPGVPVSAGPADFTAREAIARAVVERMGEAVSVEVLTVSLPAGSADRFVEAKPDPAARLGRAIRFTLVPSRGSRVATTVTLRVVGEHVVARRDLGRGMTVTGEDVQVVRAELRDTPLRRLPTGEQVIGSRVLRPVPANAVLLPGAVVVRRAVEPGDRITAVAITGDIRVSAQLTATDGGEPGDVIRVVNSDTRRSLRGRVIGEGLVEVGYAR